MNGQILPVVVGFAVSTDYAFEIDIGLAICQKQSNFFTLIRGSYLVVVFLHYVEQCTTNGKVPKISPHFLVF